MMVSKRVAALKNLCKYYKKRCKLLGTKVSLRAVSVEVLKPFACLNHELLKEKLNVNLFNLSALNLIHEILSNRKRKTCLQQKYAEFFNPLSAKFIKWSNTLKQIVGKLPTSCFSVFDHFSGLALKG